MNPTRIPSHFKASAANENGYPRVERAMPRGILPPDSGSTDEILRTLDTNRRILNDHQLLEVSLEKKGSKWPDFIGHQVFGKGLLASERVCDALAREGIGGFMAIPVEFVPPPKGKLADSEAPRYFAIKPVMEIRSRVSVFHYADGVFKPWGNYLSSEKPANAPKEEEGYCRIDQPEAPKNLSGNIFRNFPDGFGCDRRVAELAFHEKWTNLELRAFDGAYFPRMNTPSAPRVKCATGRIDSIWYSPLQEEALGQKLPAKSREGLFKRIFRF